MKQHTVLEWCAFFGLEIVDPDGFRTLARYSGGEYSGSNYMDWSMDVSTFVVAITESTIVPVDKQRFEERFNFFL